MSSRIIEDSKVVTVWNCEDCANEVEVTVDFFQDNGTPVCYCDCDMNYAYTYIWEVEDA